MTIEEKYNLSYSNGKRIYECSLFLKQPVLEHNVPFLFEAPGIKIYENGWKSLIEHLLRELDDKNPKEKGQLLSLECGWSSAGLFSENQKQGYTRYKDLFLQTYNSATHSFMNLRRILEFYNVDFSTCRLFLRKHFCVEPIEVKQFVRNSTQDDFRYFLSMKKNRTRQNKFNC